MNLFNTYLNICEATLDDVKEIKYDSGSSKEIITSFLSNKVNLLKLGESIDKGQPEISFFRQIIRDNPQINIPQIDATKVYISGPMTKHPFANYHSFYLAEAILIEGGIEQFNIINPATIKHVPGSGWVDFMINDIKGMLLNTNMLVLIEGWESSLGARVEKIVAENVQAFKEVLKRNVVETETYEKFKGEVSHESLFGNDEKIFNSNAFQAILKKMSVLAKVDFNYIYEIFKSKKVFDSLKITNSNYKIAELKNIVDINVIERAIANAIKSLNLYDEQKKNKKFINHYLEKVSDEFLKYYAFDWDDNIFKLPTKVKLRNQNNEVVESFSSEEFAKKRNDPEIIKNLNEGYKWDFGSFHNDAEFYKDMKQASYGPSWNDFVECINNASYFAIITARGHSENAYKNVITDLINSSKGGINKEEFINNMKDFRKVEGKEYDLGDETLIKIYVNECKYYPIDNPKIKKKFGSLGDASSPEKLKVKSLLDFNQYVNKKGGKLIKKIGNKEIKIGFSDDDKKNYMAVKNAIKDENMTFKYTGE